MTLLWDSELETKAIDLALQGYSCRQIGEVIGKQKNAVVGKLYRLRKQGKLRVNLRKAKRTAIKRTVIAHRNGKVVVAKFSATTLPLIDRTDEPPSLQMSLLDLENGNCRYPHGEGSQIRFCGHPVAKGAYCAFHAKICYVEPDDAV